VSFFKKSSCSVNLHGELVSSALLVNDFFRLTLDALYEQFLSGISPSHNVLLTSVKRFRIFLRSSRLWHKYFGCIFKEKLHYFMKICVLDSLDFSDFSTFFYYTRGKLIKLKIFESERSTAPLQLIHTDIYESFLTPSFTTPSLAIIDISLNSLLFLSLCLYFFHLPEI